MKNVYVIGLTGGVGAGKSTIMGYLKEKYNASILVADLIAGKMMEPGGETYDGLIEILGRDILDENLHIDKKAFAAKMFIDDSLRKKVNAYVHPKVIDYIKRRIEHEQLEALIDREERVRLVILESAIIFEGGADGLCDEIWYVRTDTLLRIERLMESRGYSREKCLDIISTQKSDEYFLEKCSIAIDNNADTQETHTQIDNQISLIKSRLEA